MNRTGGSALSSQVKLTDQALIIEGKKIPVEHWQMSVTDVQLDPGNPRIQHAVRQINNNGNISQDDLRKLILDLPGVNELFKSIRDNGGLLEPIYVRPDGRIIEGNCRAACYLRLNEIHSKDDRWQTIYACLVPEISDREVAILQGYYHVAGKNKWLAYEKAGHLHTMYTKLGMDEKAIAESLGMRVSEVIRGLKTYEIMTEKLLPKLKSSGLDKKSGGLDKWSHVEEFLKNKDLEEYRAKPENVEEFVDLVANQHLKHGADVRKLGKIIKHKPAVKALRKHGVDNAMSVVGKVDPTADSASFRKLKDTTNLLKKLPKKDLQRLRDDEQTLVILKELYSTIKDVAKAAGVKLA
jgi:hypothetical protein